jgi:subtilisin family serine protease
MEDATIKQKRNMYKILWVYIFGTMILSYTIVATISLQPAFAQANMSKTDVQKMKENLSSIFQNSTEGAGIVSDSPKFDVVIGKEIKIIPNSFIIKLKEPGDVGSMDDSISSLTLDIESLGGNVSNVYDQLGMFNIQFDTQNESLTSALGNETSLIRSEAQEFVVSLKENPVVEAVYNDGEVTIQAQVLPNDQNRVDADLSPTKSGDGAGIVNADIAIIDTGVQVDHPDLNVFKCVSFVNNPTPGVPLDSCNDGHGHGTHVAGTVAAKDDGNGVVGKASGARIWGIKVLSDSGSGSFSDILEGVNYVAANSLTIEVVNMSLGGAGTFAPLETAITNLVNNGVVVVVAAGNSNMDANNFTPARTPAAITVSAISDSDGKCGGSGPPTSRGNDDFFSTYSNHGSVVDISSPGTDVYSTYKGGGYATMSGTSMAAPNVAGAAALYKSINPSATPAQVDAYLKNTGIKMPSAPHTPLVPCDGNGKGYFNPIGDDDTIREPLLYMSSSAPMCKSGPLTGVWKNNDGGRYYIKQCNNIVWWTGMSNAGDGTAFTNVFKGKISLFPLNQSKLVGKNIVGDWCDVPRGTIMNCGLLTVKIKTMNELQKVSSTGGFGGSVWTR